MNLKSVKTTADLPFKGIELVRVDKNITEVIIGGKLRIRCGPSYSSALEVLVERAYETAQRFRLTATIDGFAPAVTYFDSQYDADTAAAKLPAGATSAIDTVEAQIDEDGKVVGIEDRAAPTPANTDDLPF
jgi:hypothetical protein